MNFYRLRLYVILKQYSLDFVHLDFLLILINISVNFDSNILLVQYEDYTCMYKL